mmetsp:Transcript_9354/g.20426  ORF Transcript_9354/g.20426 Transcript_9354/m.20426 type:complete len:357 (-) Transcript_9354:319-1389(-)
MKISVKNIKAFFRRSTEELKLGPKATNAKLKLEFNQRFELGKIIGKGNYSVVHEAFDTVTEETVAVKCIRKDKLDQEDAAALKVEVKILRNCNHPNIIRFFGMFEDDKTFYIVTELVRGGEMFDRIIERECYKEKDASAVIKSVALALKYCNDRGIVHRDLKPENILLVDEDNDTLVKLADFGFAREFSVENSNHLTTACGTPGYVAPEVISSSVYGKHVDMWSLGVIMYILLCGYPPFYHENQAKLFQQIKQGRFKFDQEFWAQVSDSAKDLISKLLVVDPNQRYTVEQLLEHPWIVQGGANLELGLARDKLKSYQARARLKKTFKAVVAVKRMEKLVATSPDAGSPLRALSAAS